MPQRRAVVKFLLGALAAARVPVAAAAEDETGVFWQVGVPGGGRGILFGYPRLTASAVPEIVRDGELFLGQVDRLLADHGGLQSPVDRPTQEPKPLLPTLRPAQAEEIRAILLGMGATVEQANRLPGVIVAQALIGEGAPLAPGEPMVGDALIGHARTRGKPVAVVMSEGEAQQMVKLMTATSRIDAPVSSEAIAFLLRMRREVGPLGAHSIRLYRERRVGALDRFTEELRRRGTQAAWRGIEAASRYYADILAARIPNVLAGSPALILVNVGSLVGKDGIVGRLRDQGAQVTPLA